MSTGRAANRTPRISVSTRNKLALWTLAAGHCEYAGCNEMLLGDILSGKETLNKAYIAHIVGAKGPRHDPERSARLENDLGNLMLLCDRCHRLIDREDVEGHPESRLLDMKRAHEERIRIVTGIHAERGTHVLHYAARIGEHDAPVSEALSKQALLPDRYPLEAPINLALSGADYRDCEADYWKLQVDTLRSQFERRIGERLRAGVVRHLSVFAIAPQPLLIELGSLLCDIADVDIRQISREPRGWAWREMHPPVELTQRRSGNAASSVIGLNLGVSAHIDDARIRAVLGDDCAIWAIEAAVPGNDVLGRQSCLQGFRDLMRKTYAQISTQHGRSAHIHIFPALPVAMAVEVGRVWMPKADPPLHLYDEQRGAGFRLLHSIGG